MIDLTKPQILAEPVKCWVRDYNTEEWTGKWLLGISDDGYFWRAIGCNHSSTPTLNQKLNTVGWGMCTLIDPYAKQMRKMTHADKERLIQCCKTINEIITNLSQEQ